MEIGLALRQCCKETQCTILVSNQVSASLSGRETDERPQARSSTRAQWSMSASCQWPDGIIARRCVALEERLGRRRHRKHVAALGVTWASVPHCRVRMVRHGADTQQGDVTSLAVVAAMMGDISARQREQLAQNEWEVDEDQDVTGKGGETTVTKTTRTQHTDLLFRDDACHGNPVRSARRYRGSRQSRLHLEWNVDAAPAIVVGCVTGGGFVGCPSTSDVGEDA